MLRRTLVGVVPALVVLAACGGRAGGSAERRTLLLDYDHDEFVGSLPAMFPRHVTVAQGDTVVFKQTWTGEPHTVTLGKLIDDLTKSDPSVHRWIREGGPSPIPKLPLSIRQQFQERLNKLPFAFSQDFRVLQNVGQPCFLDDDLPPEDPLIDARHAAEDGEYELDGRPLRGNLAGFFRMQGAADFLSFGNQFIPSTVKAKVGRKVTWSVLGVHTLSFNVPRYLPVLTFAENGRVSLNESVGFPRGGWPGQLGREVEQAAGGTAPGRLATSLDAGQWDGTGFVSTGLIGALQGPVQVTITFTKPGDYHLACLIHPRMVGEVEVS